MSRLLERLARLEERQRREDPQFVPSGNGQYLSDQQWWATILRDKGAREAFSGFIGRALPLRVQDVSDEELGTIVRCLREAVHESAS